MRCGPRSRPPAPPSRLPPPHLCPCRHASTCTSIDGHLKKFLQNVPGRTPSNTFIGGTADGAEWGAVDGIGFCQSSTCACHRLQTVVDHVFSKKLKNPSAAALKAQALVDKVMDLNGVFRHSPQSTRRLKEVQQDQVDGLTNRPVVPVGCLGVAGVRWTGEVTAIMRVQRLLPYMGMLTIGTTGAERVNYQTKVRAAVLMRAREGA